MSDRRNLFATFDEISKRFLFLRMIISWLFGTRLNLQSIVYCFVKARGQICRSVVSLGRDFD